MNILFWNVDTQKDFMLRKGSLYIEDAESILPNLKKLTDYGKVNKIKVVNTGDFHTVNSVELSNNPNFKTTFPAHCMAGTEGMEFVDETNPQLDKNDNYYIVSIDSNNISQSSITRSRNIIIYKDAFDVFIGNKHTAKILQIISPDLIVVYGVATNICVNFAVLGLAKLGYKIIVVKDAIKELPNLTVEKIYTKWKNFDVMVVSIDDVINGKNL